MSFLHLSSNARSGVGPTFSRAATQHQHRSPKRPLTIRRRHLLSPLLLLPSPPSSVCSGLLRASRSSAAPTSSAALAVPPITAKTAAPSLLNPHRRHHRRRCAPPVVAAAEGASSPSSSSNRATVVEYLLLVSAATRPDLDPDDVHEAIEAVWSLQYMVPGAGVICASAGRVFASAGGDGGGGNSNNNLTTTPTHVIHFRLANRPALERFVGHPLFARTLEDALGPLSSGAADGAAATPDQQQQQKPYAELVFEGCVDRALEPMFRRGPDYEPGGVEQLWLLSAQSTTTESSNNEASAFLARLGELAESSAAGAVQATFGPVVAASPPSPDVTHVLMARFTALGQAVAFAALPPCAAISGGGGDDPAAPTRLAALPLLARRRLLIRAGKLEEEEEEE